MSNAAQVRLHTQKTSHRISPYVHGHFIEHLGGCICDGIWVGEESDIPNDAGTRLDTVDALRKLDVPVLRWPGGLDADTDHWRDGIGPDTPFVLPAHSLTTLEIAVTR